MVERFWPGMVIVGNMLILFLNERNDGYRFAHLHGAFEVVVSQFLYLCLSETDGRTGWRDCSLAGTSTSTSLCSGLSLLLWTIIGDRLRMHRP